jgi:hypothetical protein
MRYATGDVTTRALMLACLPAMAACVPEYEPDAGTAEDAVTDVECTPLPPSFTTIRYAGEVEAGEMTETGYDHRAGISGDAGVIYHEAYTIREPDEGRYTMLSFQDFRGGDPDADRTDTTFELYDPERGRNYQAYRDCSVCVLYLVGCPHESLGACERQFMAVSGTVHFEAFEKEEDSWNQDTLQRLAVTMTDLRFREIRIDPITYNTTIPGHVCPDETCPAPDPDDPDDRGFDPEQCLVIDGYSFSYTAPE